MATVTTTVGPQPVMAAPKVSFITSSQTPLAGMSTLITPVFEPVPVPSPAWPAPVVVAPSPDLTLLYVAAGIGLLGLVLFVGVPMLRKV